MPLPAVSLTVKLYEGNFDTWCKEISGVFIARGRPTQAYPAISGTGKDGEVTYHKSTLGDMSLVIDSITPNLMTRVPEDLEVGVGPLYACLESLCKPFRLFDLPSELRIRIYEEAMPATTPQHLVPAEFRASGTSHASFHPLTRTTRRLRAEALPVYYATNTFVLAANPDEGFQAGIASSYWVYDIVRNHVKFLKSLDVTVQVPRPLWGPEDRTLVIDRLEDVVLEIRNRGAAGGLQVKEKSVHREYRLTAESREKIKVLTAKVNGEVNEHELKGKGVVSMLQKLLLSAIKLDQWGNSSGFDLEKTEKLAAGDDLDDGQ
ncbi:hypothetical protein PRZ48_010086 [Zasmidium cellare]|uniref:Uncharacterized protein n=1 Tax=Zasmidium cellare TaxID=395010 RepID=A0ABR0EDJ7_ZASCE|nr:hypothetical protein PRZ48_010086 [Zasmidium cellare]